MSGGESRRATAWDLIGWDDGLLRIAGGRAVYEAVSYHDSGRTDRVRLSRIAMVPAAEMADGLPGLRQVNRYVDADTELVPVDDQAVEALAGWWDR